MIHNSPHVKNKLAIKLAQYTVLLAFAIGFILSSIQVFEDYQEQGSHLDQTIVDILDASKPTATRAVHTLDQALAQEVVYGLMQYPFIHKVQIKDELGGVLAEQEAAVVAGGQSAVRRRDGACLAGPEPCWAGAVAWTDATQGQDGAVEVGQHREHAPLGGIFLAQAAAVPVLIERVAGLGIPQVPAVWVGQVEAPGGHRATPTQQAWVDQRLLVFVDQDQAPILPIAAKRRIELLLDHGAHGSDTADTDALSNGHTVAGGRRVQAVPVTEDEVQRASRCPCAWADFPRAASGVQEDVLVQAHHHVVARAFQAGHERQVRRRREAGGQGKSEGDAQEPKHERSKHGRGMALARRLRPD